MTTDNARRTRDRVRHLQLRRRPRGRPARLRHHADHRPGIWGPPKDHDEALRVLRRAVELGITFFDTADSYGPNVAEELIAEALHPYADDLVIATKAGLTRQGPDRWTRSASRPTCASRCELSLRRLGVERIDLFQLHRIDAALPAGGPGRRAEGPAGRGQDPPHRALRGLRRGAAGRAAGGADRVGAEQVQPRRPASQALLDHCTAEGIGFIPWRPVADHVDDGALQEVAAAHDATTVPGRAGLAAAAARR